MKINGHLEFHAPSGAATDGQIKYAIMERVTSNPGTNAVAGRIVYNSTDNLYYYHNGTTWTPFSTGGDATALQQEVNAIESTLGAMINSDGTANTGSMNSLLNVTGASTISEVLTQLDAAITGKDELGELNDVTFTGSPPGSSLAAGNLLRYTGTYWTNATLSEAGVQPLDATLTALAGYNTNGILVQTAPDTFAGRSIVASTVAGDQGISIVNGDGVAGNPTVGLDIVGLTAEAGTPSATDVLALYDGTNNVKVSITQLADAIVATSTVSLGDLSDVTDGLTGSLVTDDKYFFNATGASAYEVTAATLGALNNVAAGVDTATNEDVLAFDGSAWTAITVATMLGDGSIADLGDVTVTAPSNGDLLVYSSGSPAGWENLAPGSGSGVQPYDAGLAALAASTGTGILVQTGNDTFTHVSVAGTAGNITVTNGDGTAGNPTVNLATITDSNSGTFEKVTVDTYGRVTGTTPVVAGDITALVDATYVNVSGDTMAGNLIVPTGFDVQIADTPTNATDATNKAYVDNLVSSGTTWEKPIVDPDLVGITATEPGAPQTGGGYIATAAGTWTGPVAVVAGDYVYWDGAAWTVIENVQTGDRFIVGGEHGTAEASLTSIGLAENALVEFVATGSPLVYNLAGSWSQPHGVAGGSPALPDGTTVLASDPESAHYGHTYLWSVAENSWIEISGPGSIGAGIGLAYSGNTLNVNLGAGIVELPSDEVGIHLYSPTGSAIILTEDGTTRSTATGSMLHLLLDGGSLVQGADGLAIATGGITADMLASSVAGSGLSINTAGSPAVYSLDVNVDDATIEINADVLRVKDAGITNVKLANSTITFNGNSGSDAVALGETVSILGSNTQGINVAVTNNVWTISGLNASDTQKGVASFSSADFTVTSGAVTIKAAGVSNTQLVNDGITFAHDGGSLAAETNLGGTLTISGGTGITTSAGTGSEIIVSADTLTMADMTDVTADPSANGQVLVSGGGAGSPFTGASYTPRSIYYNETFTAATTWVVSHNLGQKYVNVTVVDGSDQVIIPQSITMTDANTTTITFNTAVAGTAIIMGVAGA